MDFEGFKLVMPWFDQIYRPERHIIVWCQDGDFEQYVYKLIEIGLYAYYGMNVGRTRNNHWYRGYGATQPMTIYNVMVLMGVLIYSWGDAR